MGTTESKDIDVLKAKYENRHKKPMKKTELIALVVALDPMQREPQRMEYLNRLQNPELVFLVYSLLYCEHKYVAPSAPPYNTNELL
jgi:hypothetical protein